MALWLLGPGSRQDFIANSEAALPPCRRCGARRTAQGALGTSRQGICASRLVCVFAARLYHLRSRYLTNPSIAPPPCTNGALVECSVARQVSLADRRADDFSQRVFFPPSPEVGHKAFALPSLLCSGDLVPCRPALLSPACCAHCCAAFVTGVLSSHGTRM